MPTTEASVVAEPSLASAAVRPALSLSWVTWLARVRVGVRGGVRVRVRVGVRCRSAG